MPGKILQVTRTVAFALLVAHNQKSIASVSAATPPISPWRPWWPNCNTSTRSDSRRGRRSRPPCGRWSARCWPSGGPCCAATPASPAHSAPSVAGPADADTPGDPGGALRRAAGGCCSGVGAPAENSAVWHSAPAWGASSSSGLRPNPPTTAPRKSDIRAPRRRAHRSRLRRSG